MKTKIKKIAAFMAVLLVVTGFCRCETLNPDAFTVRMPVMFSGYAGSAPLTNFPVLVKLSEDIPGFSYEDFSADGTNLRFADLNMQELDYEIDTWDVNGISLIWVCIPELTAETQIHAYWGANFTEHAPSHNNGAVWNAGGFFGVWHLGETDGARDSSGNELHGTLHNTSAVAEGKLGGARRISDGAQSAQDSSGVEIPNYNSLGVGNTFTASTWLNYKTGQTPGYDRIISRKSVYNASDGWEITLRQNSTTALDHRGSSGDSQSSAVFSNVSDGEWKFLTVVYNGTTSIAYLDGSLKSTKTIAAATDNNKTLMFGNNQARGEVTFKGVLDEVRLRSTVSSEDWIATEYATVADDNFATFGSIEPLDADLSLLMPSDLISVDFHSADLAWTLSRIGTSNPDISVVYGTDPDQMSSTSVIATAFDALGTYTNTLPGLLCNTTYYVCHIAVNSSGTSESPVISFKTPGEPTLGDTTIMATGTTLEIEGSLTDIGVANTTVELWIGTDPDALSKIREWSNLSAGQTFSETLTDKSFGTYYCVFRAWNECSGRINESWSAVVSDTVFGDCVWTGGGMDLSWNNPANWSSGTVPGPMDTALFTSSGIAPENIIVLNDDQQVRKLVISTVVPFIIGHADDVTAGYSLSLTDLDRQDVEGTEGRHTFAVPVNLVPDIGGNANWTINGSSELRMAAALNGVVAGVGLVKTGSSTLALNDATTYTGTTTVLEGHIDRPNFDSFGNNLGGNLVLGEPGGIVSASYTARNGGRPKNATVYKNGTYYQGDWPALGWLTVYGGTVNSSWPNINGDIKMTGGTLNGGPFERSGTGFYTYASPSTARVTGEYRAHPYGTASSFFDVEDGEVPIDLWFSGSIRLDNNNLSIIKRGAGVMRLSGSSSPFNQNSVNVNAGTLLIDNSGGAGTGRATARIAAGAILGGTGFIGGVANYSNANVVASSSSAGSPAVVAPGTLNEVTGDHIFGTLTVGSEAQSNNVTFGDNSLLRVGIGPDGAADRLNVFGTVDLSSTSDAIELTVNDDAKAGVYVLVNATEGIVGSFDTIDVPKPLQLIQTATAIEYVVPAAATLIILR